MSRETTPTENVVAEWRAATHTQRHALSGGRKGMSAKPPSEHYAESASCSAAPGMPDDRAASFSAGSICRCEGSEEVSPEPRRPCRPRRGQNWTSYTAGACAIR